MKTTKKHFKLFRKEALKWAGPLSVKDWRLDFDHNNDYEDARAWYTSMPECMVGELSLTKEWEDKITKNRIKRSGFHEIMHIRLSRIEEMLMKRGYSENEVSEVLHEVIYTFENLFYGMDD